jgi:CO/xanthine dehydrogenase Mo-binding subunit
MRFDTPATTNPIDQLKVIGRPIDRIDGLLKTTGTAPYAYERYDVVPNQAYGYVVGAAIGKGRIASIDLAQAKAAPGVLTIVTADNAGKLGKQEHVFHPQRSRVGWGVQNRYERMGHPNRAYVQADQLVAEITRSTSCLQSWALARCSGL